MTRLLVRIDRWWHNRTCAFCRTWVAAERRRVRL